MKKSIFYYGIGAILGWAGFSIGISAVTSNFWIGNSQNRTGLWNTCLRDTNTCVPLENEPWLDAVRAFMIMYVIFMFCGNVANLACQYNRKCRWEINKKGRMVCGWVWIITATFGLIGISVYTSFINQINPSGSFEYGYGFGSSWAVVCASYFAGLFNFLSANALPKHDNTL